MRRRAAGAVVGAGLCALALLAPPAAAQGIFDIFGPDRPARQAAPRSARDVPRAEKKKSEAKSQKQRKTAPAEAGKPAKQSGEAPSPPYESQLMRLSELMGALSYLRDLCAEKDGEEWRAKMTELLDAEAPDGPRRRNYIGAFNAGYRGYELTYRACTGNAKTVTARYLDEAARISRDVAYRFGSP